GIVLQDIQWRVNEGEWQLTQGTESWQFTVELEVGPNHVDVRARGFADNVSPIVSRIISRAAPIVGGPRPDMWIANGQVAAIAEDAGTLYFGGMFTHVGPDTGSGALLDATTGELSDTKSPYVSGVVYASAPDGSGGWFIGGSFTHVGGVPRRNLAHIRADGSL